MGTIKGTNGDNQPLYGTSGNDTINALAGIDHIVGSTGNDLIDGGSGSDVVFYSDFSVGVIINNTASQVGNAGAFRVLKSSGQQDTLVGIEAVHGTQFSDKIYLSNNTYVFAEGGNDEIRVGTSVLVLAGSGNDTIYGGFDSSLDYNAGDPILQMRGIVAIWNTATSGIVTDDGWGNTDKFFGIGRISGSTFSDVMTGNIGNDQMSGVAGDDYLYGNSGADGIQGGDGNDMLFGGSGDDDISGDSDDDSIYGGEGNNSLDGGDGNDVYFVQSDVVANDRIDDASGDADILQVLDTAGRDAYRLVYDGNTLVHETMQGHRTEIALAENGASVIEYLQWMGSDEYGTANYTNTLRITTDLSNISGRLIAVAGTDGDDTIVMPNETAQEGEFWGEIYANGGDDNIILSSTIQYITYASDGNDSVLGYGDIGDYVDGEAGNDSLDGNNGDDTLIGGEGDDNFAAGDGNDRLYGGSGNDMLHDDWGGNDTFDGGEGDDWLLFIAKSSGVVVDVDAGIATSYFVPPQWSTTPEQDELDYFYDIENFGGTDHADKYFGSDQSEGFRSLGGNDTIYGGSGDDWFSAGRGVNLVYGGAGNDYFVFRYEGVTTVSDVSGENWLRLERVESSYISRLYINNVGSLVVEGSGGSSITIGNYLSAIVGINWVPTSQVSWSEYSMSLVDTSIGTLNADTLQTSTSTYVEAYGSDGNDAIYINGTQSSWVSGDGGSDLIYGGVGQDTIRGDWNSTASGNDTLFGGDGNDSIDGGNGDDSILGGSGDDQLFGGSGNDIIDDGFGNDTIDGGAGIDTFVRFYDGVDYNIVLGFDLSRGLAYAPSAPNSAAEVFVDIENLRVSGEYTFILTGNSSNNSFETSAGNDSLFGLSGNDSLASGDGNDTLDGGLGSDRMTGGNGNDTYVVDSSLDTIIEFANGGIDLVQSSAATYTLGNNAENLTLTGNAAINGAGNSLSNLLTGNSAVNSISGGGGNDTIIGGGGNDILKGAAGNDSLVGGTGNDTLLGGGGNDRLTGGAGADVFVFNSAPNASSNMDTITDFVSGTDRINLAKSVMVALGTVNLALDVNAFWQGSGVVKGQDSSDRIVYNTSTGVLYYDADGSGSGAAVQLAQLGTTASHPVTLTAADFFVL